MDDDINRKPESSRKKSVFSAVFLIFFGLILGVLSYATLIGPVLGILIVGLGVYLLWRATKTDTPI